MWRLQPHLQFNIIASYGEALGRTFVCLFQPCTDLVLLQNLVYFILGEDVQHERMLISTPNGMQPLPQYPNKICTSRCLIIVVICFLGLLDNNADKCKADMEILQSHTTQTKQLDHLNIHYLFVSNLMQIWWTLIVWRVDEEKSGWRRRYCVDNFIRIK